jgi:hypothetical protein
MSSMIRLSDMALSILLVLSAGFLWVHSTGVWKMDRFAAVVGWVTPFVAGVVVGIQKERRRSRHLRAKHPVRSPAGASTSPPRPGSRRRSPGKVDRVA